MEIIHGVHRLDGIQGANCYFVISGNDGYLIDTGMPGNVLKIIDQVRKLGWNPSDIGMILITHPDIDHVGNVAELKRLIGAKVAVHQDDAPGLAGERSTKKVKGLLGLVLGVMIKLMRWEPVKPDLLLKDGETIGPFTVIHTPGHTDGSVCFYDPAKGVLFAGDALRINKQGNPCISPQVMNSNHLQAIASLKKLQGLSCQILLPGHGKPIMDGASEKIAALLAREACQ